MAIGIHTPVPITQVVTGTLVMHYPGTSVTRRLSLAEAQSIKQMVDGKRSNDALDWHHAGWIQFDSDTMVACEFDVDEDGGWSVTPEDRARLAKHHPHGVLRTLLSLWAEKGREPSYSPLALRFLANAARDGLTEDKFTTLAEQVEGEAGAQTLRSALDHLDQDAGPETTRAGEVPSSADMRIDDHVQPEDAVAPAAAGAPSANVDDQSTAQVADAPEPAEEPKD